MDGDTASLVYILLLLQILIVAIVIAVYLFFTEKKRYNEVSQNSKLLVELRKLNSSVVFFREIDSCYQYTACCDKKATFDKYDVDIYFAEYIRDNLCEITLIVEHTEANYRAFLDYSQKCRSLYESMHFVTDNKRRMYFAKIEKRIFEDERLYPVIDFTFRVYKKYVSPAGRNHYTDYRDYDCRDASRFVQKIRKEINESIAYQTTVQYERTRMTDSLRYDVMKRDGFRCQICGATQADGVKLHVDHIKPVSKGGKTVMSNLRTLCDRCNLGKSAKYDSHGPN